MSRIFLLYGGDKNSIIKKRKDIISSIAIDDFNISIYDYEKDSLLSAIGDASSIPFLGDERVVVIRNASFLITSRKKKTEDDKKDESEDNKKSDQKRDIQELNNYLLRPLESTTLIIECPYETVDQKKEVFQTIKDKGTISYFKEKGRTEVLEDINLFIKVNGLIIDKAAKDELVRRIVDDKDSYESELEKLLIYLNGEKTITLELINGLITENEEDPIYELNTAIEEKNSARALSIYYNLLDHKFDPLQIQASVINRFQSILYCKELIDSGSNKDEIMEYLHLSSGQAYYLKESASKVSYKKIKRVLDELLKLDIDTKVNYKYPNRTIGFELFLLKLC